MLIRRPSLAVLGALVTAALAVPAAAGAAPTLTTDKPCYQTGEDMRLAGQGFTPGAGVAMFFAAPSELLGTLDAKADAAGRVRILTEAPELPDGESRRATMAISANDQTKFDPTGRPLTSPEEAAGFATATLTRLDVRVREWDQGRISPHGTAVFDAYGFTLDRGETLYAHYTRNGRLVRTMAIGRLDRGCGDLKIRHAQFPAGLPAGTYTIRFDNWKGFAKKYTAALYTHVTLRRGT